MTRENIDQPASNHHAEVPQHSAETDAPTPSVAQAGAPGTSPEEVHSDADTGMTVPAEDREVSLGVERRPLPRWMVIVIGVTLLGMIAALSALLGYRRGIVIRQSAESTQVALAAAEQYELGLQDMQNGDYVLARQRFEYVIRIDPSYPGVVEQLAKVLKELNTTATPTLIPTPTLSPTPDLRGVQELFDQAQQHLLNSEWSQAIETLLTLRKNDPTYRTVDVDGMLFLALRQRGEDKILLEADLEGGMYDLTLAERFGILDEDAKGLMTWTSLYITGASFWGLDWEQAVYYFSQVAPQMPGLRDGSGLTARERYRLALIEYGKWLASLNRWCPAAQQLELALSMSYDPEVDQMFQTAANNCAKGEKKSEKTPTP